MPTETPDKRPTRAKRETGKPPETSETPSVDTATEAEELAKTVFGDELAKRPVIVKLARIMAGLPELKPEGENKHFGYSYIKDTQVSGALRKRLADERLMIIPDVISEEWVETETARGGTSWVTKMHIRFTVIDGDSGDETTGSGFGYGDDSGDKGANKAFTSALKYWLLKLFQIGGEDLENDPRADERAGGRQSGDPATQAASGTVNVEAANITGVARGGHSDKITRTQANQLMALYRDLSLTPELFVDLVDEVLGDKWSLDDDADASAQLNTYVKALSSEDAGKLISGLVEIKDKRQGDAAHEAQAAAAEAAGYEPGYG